MNSKRLLLTFLLTVLVASAVLAQSPSAPQSGRTAMPFSAAPFDHWIERTFPPESPIAMEFRLAHERMQRGAGTAVAMQSRVAPLAAPAPSLASVFPTSGPTAGGGYMSVTGFNFAPGATVTFGGVPATGVSVDSCSTISGSIPPHAAGAVDVVVTNPDTQTATLVGSFTYSDTPLTPFTITAVSPSSGPAAGGTSITITGTGFPPNATVNVWNVPATNVRWLNSTTITATTPPGQIGPRRVWVEVNHGMATGWVYTYLDNGFTYVPPAPAAPTISSFTPTSGGPGTIVTITGTNFLSVESVWFTQRVRNFTDGHWTNREAWAPNFTVVSPTQITAEVPRDAVVGPITVETVFGFANSCNSFTPPAPAAPTITSFPASANVGTTLTIKGTNFRQVTEVDIDGIPVYFWVYDDSTLNANVPIGARPGAITVANTTATATSATTFTPVYCSSAPKPTITSFTPGAVAPGDGFVITGTNYKPESWGSVVMRYGGGAIRSEYSLDGTQVNVYRVPALAQSGPISIFTDQGSATTTDPLTITSIPAASITSIDPTAANPGTPVSISSSTSLKGTSDVLFNNTPTAFDVSFSPAYVPLGATAGALSVVSQSGTGIGPIFTPTCVAPTITKIDTTSGSPGTWVSFTGTNFGYEFQGYAMQFFFNGVLVPGAYYGGGTGASTRVPAEATTGPVRIQTPYGVAVGPDFTVTPAAPTITSFVPSSGPAGTVVTIIGSNFATVTDVKFNGTSASFSIVDGKSIIATAPASVTTGPISVTNPAGTAASSSPFTVTAATPTISGFAFRGGVSGDSVTIAGTNFTGATAVTFNGVAASSFVVNNSSIITATVPASATTGPIAVTTPAGTATSSTSFTIQAWPTITSVTPNSGPTAGGTSITITGTNFVSGATVSIGGTAATNVSVVGATSITARTPQASSAGAVDVTVTNATGQFASLTNGFTYSTVSRGDANGDGQVTVADVFSLINSLFVTGAQVGAAGDANNDGIVSAADIFFLINYLFAGGRAPQSIAPTASAAPGPAIIDSPVASLEIGRVSMDGTRVSLPVVLTGAGDIDGLALRVTFAAQAIASIAIRRGPALGNVVPVLESAPRTAASASYLVSFPHTPVTIGDRGVVAVIDVEVNETAADGPVRLTFDANATGFDRHSGFVGIGARLRATDGILRKRSREDHSRD